jgi:hypothetical protein
LSAAALSTAKAADPDRSTKAVAIRKACAILLIVNLHQKKGLSAQDIIPATVKAKWQ